MALRLRSGLSGPVKFDLLKIDSDAAPCIPEPGGNLNPDRERSLHPPLTVERG